MKILSYDGTIQLHNNLEHYIAAHRPFLESVAVLNKNFGAVSPATLIKSLNSLEEIRVSAFADFQRGVDPDLALTKTIVANVPDIVNHITIIDDSIKDLRSNHWRALGIDVRYTYSSDVFNSLQELEITIRAFNLHPLNDQQQPAHAGSGLSTDESLDYSLPSVQPSADHDNNTMT